MSLQTQRRNMGRVAENTKIQGRLWDLSVGRLARNCVSAKRRCLHRGLAQIPKILRCLIPKEINSHQMANCPVYYIKEAERNDLTSIRIDDAILQKSPQQRQDKRKKGKFQMNAMNNFLISRGALPKTSQPRNTLE